MKHTFSYIVCLLAVVGWIGHEFVPHHHVGCCTDSNVMEVICWNTEEHHHENHAEEHDQNCHHEGEQHGQHSCIFLTMLPLAPEKVQLQITETEHFCELGCTCCTHHILKNLSAQKIYDRPKDDCLLYACDFLKSCGLRAPPAA